MKVFLAVQDSHDRLGDVEMSVLPRVGNYMRIDNKDRQVLRRTWIIAGGQVSTWEVRLGEPEA